LLSWENANFWGGLAGKPCPLLGLLASLFPIVRLARNPARGLTSLLTLALLVGGACLAGLVASGSGPARADQLATLQQQASQIATQLQQLSGQIDQIDQEYLQAQSNLSQIQSQIEANKGKLAGLAQQEERQKALLRQAAIAAYIEAGSGGAATDILSSSSQVAQLKSQYLRTESANVKQYLSQLVLTEDQIKEAQTQLDKEYAQQAEVVRQLGEQRASLEQKSAQVSSLLASLKGQIATLVSQIQAQQAAERAREAAARFHAQVGEAPATPVNIKVVPPPAGSKVSVVISTAESYLGDPYAWGGMSHSGIDCSGLVVVSWGAAGVSLPRTAQGEYEATAHVPLDPSAWEPGDLIFYGGGVNDITHVAIYLGNGTVIQAANYQYGVVETSVYWAGEPVAVGRP
jgi:cell wall-associated NlpC family hydrolase